MASKEALFSKKEIISYFIIVMIAVLLAAGLHWGEFVTAIETIVMFGLVLITAVYAERTARIAEATEKQANEIKKSRLDSVLPIIDLVWNPDDHPEDSHKTGDMSCGFLCVVRNVGLGPATDVWAPVVKNEGVIEPMSYKTLEQKDSAVATSLAALPQVNGKHGIHVLYKDAHGRWFDSSRGVEWDAKAKKLIMNQLYIREVPKSPSIDELGDEVDY